MIRLPIRLTEEEFRAITSIAKVERRDARDQAAILIRRELERAGLIQRATSSRRDGTTKVPRRTRAAADAVVASTLPIEDETGHGQA
jgi:hypothetical protein